MGIRDYFSRHLLKHINVYKIDDFTLEPPDVHKLEHSVNVAVMKPEVKVNASSVEISDTVKCKAVKVLIQEKRIQAKSYRVKHYVKQEIKAHSHEVKSRIRTHDSLKQIRDMPLEFQDMLKYQTSKPKLLNNEILLAWYGPIVEGAVIKLVWNKQRGTLLVWYNPQSRHFKAKGVYLIRRLGLGEKPEWRWV